MLSVISISSADTGKEYLFRVFFINSGKFLFFNWLAETLTAMFILGLSLIRHNWTLLIINYNIRKNRERDKNVN